jgi:hypothetical protein
MCMHTADTIRTVECYSDIIVLRHFESGSTRRAAETTDIATVLFQSSLLKNQCQVSNHMAVIQKYYYLG